MAGIFIFSEDSALAKQLLTPALELKKSLAQPLTTFALSEADAKELAALGADKAVVLQSANKWVEGFSEAIYSQVSKAEGSILLVGGTLRGKHVAAYVAAKLNAAMTTDAKTLRIEGGKLLATRVLYAGLAVCEEEVTLPAVATIRARTFLAPTAAATAATWARPGTAEASAMARSRTPTFLHPRFPTRAPAAPSRILRSPLTHTLELLL